MHMNSTEIKNPYPSMVGSLLRKYPNLRFQDCFTVGNQWEKGNDYYRYDHPVMQFVAHQLDLMNQGFSRRNAFAIVKINGIPQKAITSAHRTLITSLRVQTEKLFYERRMDLERQQKTLMAQALFSDVRVEPMFTSGKAYWVAEMAKREAAVCQWFLRYVKAVSDAYVGKIEPEDITVLPPTPSPPFTLTREDILRLQTFVQSLSREENLSPVTKQPTSHGRKVNKKKTAGSRRNEAQNIEKVKELWTAITKQALDALEKRLSAPETHVTDPLQKNPNSTTSKEPLRLPPDVKVFVEPAQICFSPQNEQTSLPSQTITRPSSASCSPLNVAPPAFVETSSLKPPPSYTRAPPPLPPLGGAHPPTCAPLAPPCVGQKPINVVSLSPLSLEQETTGSSSADTWEDYVDPFSDVLEAFTRR